MPVLRRIVAACAVVAGVLMLAAPADAGTVRLQDECPSCGGGPGKVLVWRGEPGEANRITVRLEGRDIVVTEHADAARLVSASSDCVVDGNEARCTQPQSFYFFLYGEDGDDELSTDALMGSFSDYLFGGPGDDVLDAGDHDCCVGARLQGDAGDDVLRGGTGEHDEAVYSERTQPLRVSLAPLPAGAQNGAVGEHDAIAEDVDGMWGGDGDDWLQGDEGANYIWTGDGVDTVWMGAGRDVLWGSSWYDRAGDEVHGEDGDDHFYPGPRPGLIVGDAGNDTVYLDNFGPAWFSRMSLDGKANDGGIFRSDDPWAERRAPDGNLLVENLVANDAADQLIGDAGDNTLGGEGGADIIQGAAGHDRVFGDGYNEAGDDFIHVLDGEADSVSCGGGLDLVLADPLLDHLDADCEHVSADDLPLPDLQLPALPLPDLPTLPLPDAPTVPLAGSQRRTNPTASCRTIRYSKRRVSGSARDDCLAGTARGDRIAGNGGHDRLVGRRGNDALQGGTGGDHLDAGAGDDLLDGARGTDVLLGGAGRDRLRGGAGDDFLLAADGRRDVVDCGPGSDAAAVDERDVVRNCEHVATARSADKG